MEDRGLQVYLLAILLNDVWEDLFNAALGALGSLFLTTRIRNFQFHLGLWTAVRNQLLAKYARDPSADGFGIYLVIWFGQDRR